MTGNHSSQKPDVTSSKSATLERNKKISVKFEHKPKPVVGNIKIETEKAKTESIVVVAGVVANPGELKKTESGESDPGYESDSVVNKKLGIKVDPVVVPPQQQQQQQHQSGTNTFSKKKSGTTKLIESSLSSLSSSSSSSKTDPKLVISRTTKNVDMEKGKSDENWNKETSKSNHQIRGGHKEKGLTSTYATSVSSSKPPPNYENLNELDGLDTSELVHKIMSSSIIDEMSCTVNNIKPESPPVTLEIFSPVMVRC
jgi:hypothetical protein